MCMNGPPVRETIESLSFHMTKTISTGRLRMLMYINMNNLLEFEFEYNMAMLRPPILIDPSVY